MLQGVGRLLHLPSLHLGPCKVAVDLGIFFNGLGKLRELSVVSCKDVVVPLMHGLGKLERLTVESRCSDGLSCMPPIAHLSAVTSLIELTVYSWNLDFYLPYSLVHLCRALPALREFFINPFFVWGEACVANLKELDAHMACSAVDLAHLHWLPDCLRQGVMQNKYNNDRGTDSDSHSE